MKIPASYLLHALCGAVFLSLPLVVKADTTLLVRNDAVAPTPGTGGSIENYVIGVAFTPAETITVTELGAYAGDLLNDDNQTTQNFTAVLYTFTGGGSANNGDGVSEAGVGTVIDNAVIHSGTGVNADDVAFTKIAPLTLTAGVQYFIGADGGTPITYATSDADYLQEGLSSANYGVNSDFYETPNASQVVLTTSGYSMPQPVATGALNVGSTQAFNLSNAYFAGDLQYVVGSVPEPSALPLLGTGLGFLAFWLLRRRPAA